MIRCHPILCGHAAWHFGTERVQVADIKTSKKTVPSGKYIIIIIIIINGYPEAGRIFPSEVHNFNTNINKTKLILFYIDFRY